MAARSSAEVCAGGGGSAEGGDCDAVATTLLLVSGRGRCSTAPVFGADVVAELADEDVERRGGVEEEPQVVHSATHTHVAIRHERRAVVHVMVPTGGVVVLPPGQQHLELELIVIELA